MKLTKEIYLLWGTLTVILFFLEWWVAFWIHHPRTKRPYFVGGLGKGAFYLASKDIFEIKLRYGKRC